MTIDECSSHCDLIGCMPHQRTSQPHVMQGLLMIGLSLQTKEPVACYLFIHSFVHLSMSFVAVSTSVWQANMLEYIYGRTVSLTHSYLLAVRNLTHHCDKQQYMDLLSSYEWSSSISHHSHWTKHPNINEYISHLASRCHKLGETNKN